MENGRCGKRSARSVAYALGFSKGARVQVKSEGLHPNAERYQGKCGTVIGSKGFAEDGITPRIEVAFDEKDDEWNPNNPNS